MKKKIGLMLVLAGVMGCVDNKEVKEHVNDVRIDSLMQVCFRRGIFNGNILVVKNDTILYKNSLGFADGSGTRKLNTDMVFNIGSISKEFSAVALMKLVEEKKISLEDRVSKFDLKLPVWADRIEISHLLNYSSGLPRYDWETVRTDEDVYDDLKTIDELVFEPGTSFLYSNNNVFIRKLIIQKVSGMSFNEYIKRNMLEPLGMKSTFLTPIDEKTQFAKGFNKNGEDFEDVYKMSGATYTSIDDLHKWIKGLHSEKIIGSGSRNILSKAFTKDYYVETSLGASNQRDGFMIRHQHSGSHVDYESLIDHNLDNNLTVILLANTSNGRLWKIDHAINAAAHNQPYLIPNHSIKDAIREKCKANINDGISYYHQLKSENIEGYSFDDPGELNSLGYEFLRMKRAGDATKIFELLVAEFPDSSNAYDSLAEAYYMNGNHGLSLKNYEKSLEFNPGNSNAKKWIKTIREM